MSIIQTGCNRLCAALLLSGFALTGCAELGLPQWSEVQTLVPSIGGEAEGPIPVSGAQTAEELDTATDEERAEATSDTNTGQRLGATVATLGSAAEQGFWLKTALVTTEQAGVLRSRDTEKSVAVTLIPIDGPPTSGSRISLSAMRALELPLTAIAELNVSLDG